MISFSLRHKLHPLSLLLYAWALALCAMSVNVRSYCLESSKYACLVRLNSLGVGV